MILSNEFIFNFRFVFTIKQARFSFYCRLIERKNPTKVSFYFARLAFLLRDREIDKKKFLTKTVLESRIVFALLTKETHEFALFSNNSADYNQHFFVSSLTFQTIN